MGRDKIKMSVLALFIKIWLFSIHKFFSSIFKKIGLFIIF